MFDSLISIIPLVCEFSILLKIFPSLLKKKKKQNPNKNKTTPNKGKEKKTHPTLSKKVLLLITDVSYIILTLTLVSCWELETA